MAHPCPEMRVRPAGPPPGRRMGNLQRSPDLAAGGEGARCPSPRTQRTPFPLSAFGLDFRSFGSYE